mgnify:CR=1 FL=1
MKRIAILLVVLVFGAVAASAQVTKISSAEFSKAMDAAFLASGAKVRRETKAIIGFENGKIVENSTAIEEFIPPDRSRSLFVEEFAGRKSETEWIIISGQRYKKAADGGWFKTEPLPVVNLAVTTAKQHAENDKTMKFTREVRKIGKNLVTILSRSEKSAPGEVPWTAEMSIFVKSDGLIGSITERHSENGLSSLKTEATTYVYDPKDLKIDLPNKY